VLDTKEEAEQVVRVGDSATFALKYQPLRNGLAASVAMDDKIGLWVVLEAFRRAVAAGPYPVLCLFHRPYKRKSAFVVQKPAAIELTLTLR